MRMEKQRPELWSWGRGILLVLLMLAARNAYADQQPQAHAPTGPTRVTLEADQQRKIGDVFFADGNVDLRYKDVRLRADHAEYHDETGIVVLNGHVQYDRESQHLDADSGTYDVHSGHGTFQNVRGTIQTDRRPNPQLLLSPNPISFEAAEVERIDENTYKTKAAWFTVCDPEHPKWKFYSQRATIYIERTVRMEGATMEFLSVPILYFPYVVLPDGKRVRQSGFLTPDIGQSSTKGFVLGDSYYWAPTGWFDSMLGADLYSLRGWAQDVEIRGRPSDDVRFKFTYFGVVDRGIVQDGVLVKQGGHDLRFTLDALLKRNWHLVADLNQLTSLTFRLAFSPTFSEAVNSEIYNTVFASHSFHGFNLSFAALGYQNFLNPSEVTSTTPEESITLRAAPEARLSSFPQAPWSGLPLYFGFETFVDAVYRDQPADDTAAALQTPAMVQRMEFAPNVTMPLRWGPWLGVTPSFTVRSTRYGTQLEDNGTLGWSFVRTTEELSVDIRPPAFAKVWDRGDTKWKHDIEPDIVYRYVTGVDDYSRFIRFDEDDTLTDTNEVEYSLTQRLFRRSGDDDAQEFLSWRVTQKYFFDPTFGGAIVLGQRNVFQTFDSLTPFSFAIGPRHFSPIVSDLRISPGRRYDAQFRVDYDPQRNQMTAIGVLLKMKPYRESYVTLAQFSTINLPIPPPNSTEAASFLSRSNQVQGLVGYGESNRIGWNSAVGFSYDVSQHYFQNKLAQISYNGSCCGISFEYLRLSLASVRVENQFRVVILFANIGSAGNIRRNVPIF